MNNSKANIAIIGLGWLGLPLAKSLQQQFNVIGTVTSDAKRSLLAKDGVEAVCYNAREDATLPSNIKACSTVIITLPLGLRHGHDDYPQLIARVLNSLSMDITKHIILTSSIGIYQGLSGNVNEQHALVLTDPKAKLLQQAEQLVQQYSANATILRLGGLFGPQRHPGRFVSANRPVQLANQPVNLVHLTDVIAAIQTVIKESMAGCFNLVCPDHPSKAEFYRLAAQQLGAAMPEFISDSQQTGKCVDGNAITKQSSFRYAIDNLTRWLLADALRR